MATRADAVRELRTWIGVPWRHQGRTRFGVDCVGLISVLAGVVRGPEFVAQYDRTDYGRKPTQYSLTEALAPFCDLIAVGQLQEGDVVSLADGPYPCHLGVLSMQQGQMYIIHSSARLRKVTEEPFGDFWRGRLSRCYSPRGYT